MQWLGKNIKHSYKYLLKLECFFVKAVLLASGVPKKLAATSVRLSVGRDTTTEDIDMAVEDLKTALNSLTVDSSNNISWNLYTVLCTWILSIQEFENFTFL